MSIEVIEAATISTQQAMLVCSRGAGGSRGRSQSNGLGPNTASVKKLLQQAHFTLGYTPQVDNMTGGAKHFALAADGFAWEMCGSKMRIRMLEKQGHEGVRDKI